jgi:hypothetical protein
MPKQLLVASKPDSRFRKQVGAAFGLIKPSFSPKFARKVKASGWAENPIQASDLEK